MAKPIKREEIVRAALELIAEQGFHGAPMALVAKRAGVGAGTIYRYFANKDEMITELYRELEERILPVLMKDYNAKGSVRERFLHLGTALLRYFILNPLDFRYLEQYHNSPYGVECRREKLLGEGEKNDVYRELFEEGMRRGEIKELPLPVLCALTFGPLSRQPGIISLASLMSMQPLINNIISACWDAVRV